MSEDLLEQWEVASSENLPDGALPGLYELQSKGAVQLPPTLSDEELQQFEDALHQFEAWKASSVDADVASVSDVANAKADAYSHALIGLDGPIQENAEGPQ